ncbi:hypothetical protein [Saccharothrix stipae]
MSDPDPASGTFELHDEGRAVRVALAPDLLAEYFDQLDEHDIPGLSRSPQDEQDEVRVRRIALWVEEMFEADIRLSLVEIRLGRSAGGRISLVDRRGPVRRSIPTGSGHWSPDRPGA